MIYTHAQLCADFSTSPALRLLSRVCFGLRTDMDHNLTELQPQQVAKEFNCESYRYDFYMSVFWFTF